MHEPQLMVHLSLFSTRLSTYNILIAFPQTFLFFFTYIFHRIDNVFRKYSISISEFNGTRLEGVNFFTEELHEKVTRSFFIVSTIYAVQ